MGYAAKSMARMKTTPPLLSILIPSMPERLLYVLPRMMRELSNQIDRAQAKGQVQLLSLLDNKDLLIGAKRNMLLELAGGDFLTFVDDDDDISPDYLQVILAAIKKDPDADVFVMEQMQVVPGMHPVSIYHNPDQTVDALGNPESLIKMPAHTCVWKSALAKKFQFPNIAQDEDIKWARAIRPSIKKAVYLNGILYFYNNRHMAAREMRFA